MLDDILTFCVNLSRNMIVSGANLERVHLAVEFICKAYGLHDVSIFLLSSYISVAAYDEHGNYSSHQASIPPSGIHLERLRSLNQLSYKVTEITPAPKLLAKMLERAMNVPDYSDVIVLAGKICAASCLSFMFGGNFADLIPVAIVTAIIHFVMRMLESTGLDRIVINALTMFIATAVSVIFVYSGVGSNLAVVLITVSMLVIPGVPLVNAMRNMLCGMENNGILQMLKITVETLALAMGIFAAFIAFKGYMLMDGAPVSLTTPYLLVLLSFTASLGFGVVFRIAPNDIFLAGLGGALTRIALLTFSPVIPSRLLYMTLSASVAALYAEFWAVKRRQPSTYFVYPSIIPLIPGDLFFFTIAGLYVGNREFMYMNGTNCIISLLGLSIGFVLSSTISLYVRRMRYRG